MKTSILTFLLGLALFAIHSIHSAPEEHLKTYMPGYEGELPSKMYQGYIPLFGGKFHLNYIFVESYNQPETAPVCLWMQGGPGASGIFAFYTEIGPFSLDQSSFTDDENVIQPILNPYSWSQNVNMIFFESPSPVGFSYYEGEFPTYDDTSSAEHNYEFLHTFFEFFPEYKKNDFYIAGESYAGIYIPSLAHQILTNENDINLKGVIIGNGCTGILSEGACSTYDSQFMIDFLYNHGQISTKLHNEILENCAPDDFLGKCKGYLDSVMKEAGHHNDTNIYSECAVYEHAKVLVNITGDEASCYQTVALPKYMNLPTTKAFFNSEKEWTISIDEHKFYTWSLENTFPFFKEMMDKGLKIMIYFGDIDNNVPYNSGYAWMTKNFKKISDWEPWTFPMPNKEPWYPVGSPLVCGHIEQYEGATFATVKGAGHMVPTDKPKQALLLFENFIFDIPFEKFNSS